MITKRVTIADDLSATVKVLGMPVTHLNRLSNLQSLSLKKYVSKIDQMHACQGVTDARNDTRAILVSLSSLCVAASSATDRKRLILTCLGLARSG